ncbi:DUF636 domain-containing protein [Coprinopsis marcescibilis]|uniref:DUF636 domain-containing protein n=1 Tax=Coprinopsis marcescibilis TaxID=230819 RepID=A0A5C3KRL0_COPMA|nr:DUF636 domain-containing protein [Coprinopsis marcescibilis]
MASKTYSGNCLCGEIAFSIEGEPFHFVICHCSNCKQSGGGAFQANGFFKPQQVNLTKGRDVVKDYVDANTKSGKSITRSFCPNCGTSLFITPTASGIAIVHVANIKGSENWVPKKESFAESRCSWIKEIELLSKKQSKL